MAKVILFVLFAATSVVANAASVDPATQLSKPTVTVRDVMMPMAATSQPPSSTLLNACDGQDSGTIAPLDSSINWASLINLGEQAWDLIKDNQPVLQFAGDSASALPGGVHCWTQLENWSFPKTKLIQVSYTNGWGIKVVNFAYRLTYTYGGDLQGRGKFLSNVQIVPQTASVVIPFRLEASVTTGEIVNLGTTQSPLAGIHMIVSWTVDSQPITLVKHEETRNYFIEGNGNFVDLDQQ